MNDQEKINIARLFATSQPEQILHAKTRHMTEKEKAQCDKHNEPIYRTRQVMHSKKHVIYTGTRFKMLRIKSVINPTERNRMNFRTLVGYDSPPYEAYWTILDKRKSNKIIVPVNSLKEVFDRLIYVQGLERVRVTVSNNSLSVNIDQKNLKDLPFTFRKIPLPVNFMKGNFTFYAHPQHIDEGLRIASRMRAYAVEMKVRKNGLPVVFDSDIFSYAFATIEREVKIIEKQ